MVKLLAKRNRLKIPVFTGFRLFRAVGPSVTEPWKFTYASMSIRKNNDSEAMKNPTIILLFAMKNSPRQF
jgi:hypothetical protein